MPVEIKGQQLRIRVKSPSLFVMSSFRTHDVGKTGKLQRVTARLKKSNKWETQSWRLNLSDYPNKSYAKRDIISLRIPEYRKQEALSKLGDVM